MSKKSQMVGSMGAAASILGCDMSSLKAAKRAGAPGFKPNNSVNIEEVRKWLKSQPPLEKGEVSKSSLEVRRLQLQCEKLEHDVAVSKKAYTLNAEIRADLRRIGAAMRASLQTLRADVPNWEGLSAAEMQCRMDERCEEMCSELHDQTSTLYAA